MAESKKKPEDTKADEKPQSFAEARDAAAKTLEEKKNPGPPKTVEFEIEAGVLLITQNRQGSPMAVNLDMVTKFLPATDPRSNLSGTRLFYGKATDEAVLIPYDDFMKAYIADRKKSRK